MIHLLIAAAVSTPPVWQPVAIQMQKEIMAKVGDQLLDGPSARYRWPKENRKGVEYCGFVNGKNAFGAYIGFKPFYVMGAHMDGPKGNGGFQVMQVYVHGGTGPANNQIIETACAEAGFDLSQLPPE